MEAMVEAQDLARRFNESEAVWRCYERKRALRRLLGSRPFLPEKTLDDLNWQAAERECREVRAVGFFQT
jgi:Tfp pilus assembly protein PilN